MPYKKTPEEASLWYKGHYCNYIGKDKLYCGCMKNQTFGDFCGKHKSNFLNKKLEKLFNNFHLLKLLLDILAFKRTRGIFFFLILIIIFGHISDSINMAIDGLQ